MRMKRNFLFTVAILFMLCMTAILAGTHVFDEREKQPVYTPKKVERALPKLPHFAP